MIFSLLVSLILSSRSAYNKTRRSKLCRKAIPSLPDLGSIELVNRGTELAESHRPELIAFTSCTIELMYHVTKLHRGITHKVRCAFSRYAFGYKTITIWSSCFID